MKKRSNNSINAKPAIPPITLPTTVGVEIPPPPPPPEELEDDVGELGELFVGEEIAPPPAPADAVLAILVLRLLLSLDEDEFVLDRVVVEFELNVNDWLVDGCTVMIVPFTKESSKVEVLVEVVVVSEEVVMVVVWLPPITLIVVSRMVETEALLDAPVPDAGVVAGGEVEGEGAGGGGDSVD